MKKFIIIAIIGLLGFAALLGSAEEDVPEETEADTKAEETSDKDDNKAQSETTDKDKEETERKREEQKAEEEQEAKEKAEAERKQEEKKAEEERKVKEEQEVKQKAKEEQEAKRKAEEEAEAQAKAEEAEKLRKENEAKEIAEQEAADKANVEEIYLQIMRESVGSYVDIQFDKTEKTYVMTPTDQGLIDEISMLPLGIGHEDWGILVDGMTSMSRSGKDLVGEGYTINLVNPLNHENVILWITDGVVIYNVIDDL